MVNNYASDTYKFMCKWGLLLPTGNEWRTQWFYVCENLQVTRNENLVVNNSLS